MTSEPTFRRIEVEKGISVPTDELDSSLGQWYAGVRDKELRSFDDEDLCIACRQLMYLEYTVPVALSRLETEPLAGKKYDGELIIALKSVPLSFWSTHTQEVSKLRSILAGITDFVDADLRADIAELVTALPTTPA